MNLKKFSPKTNIPAFQLKLNTFLYSGAALYPKNTTPFQRRINDKIFFGTTWIIYEIITPTKNIIGLNLTPTKNIIGLNLYEPQTDPTRNQSL